MVKNTNIFQGIYIINLGILMILINVILDDQGTRRRRKGLENEAQGIRTRNQRATGMDK